MADAAGTPLQALAGLGLACALCAAPPAWADGAATSVQLQHLALDLQLDWPARQLVGVASLQLLTTTATQQVQLRAADLAVHTVHDGAGQPLAHRSSGSGDAGRLVIDLPQPLPAATPLTLHIAYRSRHVQADDPTALWGHTGRGLRWFAPSAADPRRRQQVWTSGEPGTQAWWLPLPADDAVRFTSAITLTVDRPLVAVASGVPVPPVSLPGGARRYAFRSAASHTAQRLGFVVGAFVEIPQQAEGVALMNWSLPDEAAGTAASVVRLPEMLRFMAAHTGLPPPLPHYAQVFVQGHPWGHGAQGLAVQSENMVDDFGVHADFLYLWDLLEAETLAQQWFGGAVSACDARHAWWMGGLARQAAMLDTSQAHGDAEGRLYPLAADQATLLTDAGPLLPAEPPPAATSTTAPTGNGPGPGRAAAVLHLLRAQLGAEAYGRGLRQFMQAHAGRSACTAALQQAMEAASGQPLGAFFQRWVQGSGHPVFQVRTEWDAGSRQLQLVLRQTQAGPPVQGRLVLDLGGTLQTVQRAAQPEQTFSFTLAQRPRWVQVDPDGDWPKDLQHPQPLDDLLQQLRHTRHAMGRLWAGQQVAALWRQGGLGDAERAAAIDALRDVAGTPGRWWRERFIVLNLLRSLLAPATPDGAVVLGADLQRTLLAIVRDEGSWLRATALRLLGDSRDPAHAPLYLAHLADPSDRVINAAAIGLGRSGDLRAFDALAALPAHPSWKQQSLISALAGLQELRDARGGDIALAALADVASPRWVLATPVWDTPLAAAGTLAALRQGHRALPLLQARLATALADGRSPQDVFYTAMLIATLGDAGGLPVLDDLRQRHAGDAAALQATDGWARQLRAAVDQAGAERRP